MITIPHVIERLLRHDRLVTPTALVGISLLAWAYILAGAGMDVHSISIADMVKPMDWTAPHFALMLAMWIVMMIAMMLPSAVPVILLFETIERRRGQTSPLVGMTAFVGAYLAVWAGFSLVATLAQWALDRLGMLSTEMAMTSGMLAGLVLIAAGVYQFMPLKQACLRACQSPLEFISRHWNSGPFGIGIRHGLYCLGCCWALMLLLFVGGAMNIGWVALIAAFVLIEKLVRGRLVGYLAGVALTSGGIWLFYLHKLAIENVHSLWRG